MSIPACASCGQPVSDEIRWGDAYPTFCGACDLKIARALHPSGFSPKLIDPDWVKAYRKKIEADGDGRGVMTREDFFDCLGLFVCALILFGTAAVIVGVAHGWLLS